MSLSTLRSNSNSNNNSGSAASVGGSNGGRGGGTGNGGGGLRGGDPRVGGSIPVRRSLPFCSCKDYRGWERFPGCAYEGGNNFMGEQGQGGCNVRSLATLKCAWSQDLQKFYRMLPMILKDAMFRTLTFDVTCLDTTNVSQITYEDRMAMARNGLYNTKVFRANHSRFAIRCAFCSFQHRDESGVNTLNVNKIKFLHARSHPYCAMQYRQYTDIFSGNRDYEHNWALFGLKNVGPRSFDNGKWTGASLKVDAKPRRDHSGGNHNCKICLVKRVNILQSCGHAILCSDCWASKSNVPICCVCKKDVVWYKKILIVLKSKRITLNDEVAGNLIADFQMDDNEPGESEIDGEGEGDDDDEDDVEEGETDDEDDDDAANGGGRVEEGRGQAPGSYPAGNNGNGVGNGSGNAVVDSGVETSTSDDAQSSADEDLIPDEETGELITSAEQRRRRRARARQLRSSLMRNPAPAPHGPPGVAAGAAAGAAGEGAAAQQGGGESSGAGTVAGVGAGVEMMDTQDSAVTVAVPGGIQPSPTPPLNPPPPPHTVHGETTYLDNHTGDIIGEFYILTSSRPICQR